jgi:hypothetical protein
MGVWLNSEFFTDSLHNIIEKSMRNWLWTIINLIETLVKILEKQ